MRRRHPKQQAYILILYTKTEALGRRQWLHFKRKPIIWHRDTLGMFVHLFSIKKKQKTMNSNATFHFALPQNNALHKTVLCQLIITQWFALLLGDFHAWQMLNLDLFHPSFCLMFHYNFFPERATDLQKYSYALVWMEFAIYVFLSKGYIFYYYYDSRIWEEYDK